MKNISDDYIIGISYGFHDSRSTNTKWKSFKFQLKKKDLLDQDFISN